jgi:hypothetical protein
MKRAHRGLVEDGVARPWRELVQDLVLTPAAGVADGRGEALHVRQEVAEVGQLRSDGEVDDPEAVLTEEVEQPLYGRHDDMLDPVETVLAERFLPGCLQRTAQSLESRGARVLHVDGDQRNPRRVEHEPRIELKGVVPGRRRVW